MAEASPAETLVIGLPREDTRKWTADQVLRRPWVRQLELFAHPELLEVVDRLPRLERLHLHGITVRDAGPLLRAYRLKRLVITLGTTDDFSFVPRMQALEELWLIKIRGVDTLGAITGSPTLRVLWLENLPRVERLPPLSGMPALRRLELIDLKSLASIEAALHAPGLQQLKVGLRQASPAMLEPLGNHPGLSGVLVATGSARRNASLNAVLGAEKTWNPDFTLMGWDLEPSPARTPRT